MGRIWSWARRRQRRREDEAREDDNDTEEDEGSFCLTLALVSSFPSLILILATVVHLLRRYFGEYVHGLSAEALRISVWKGAHILSGNVFEPRALNELFPQWKQEEAPIHVPVSSDKFLLLTKNHAIPLPCPFDNKGNYVISLSQLVRWMGQKAEELGVEIYPGFAATEVLYDCNDNVGIATNDMGIAKDGSERETFKCGVELKGRITLFAEGCRGSLSEKIIKKC